MCNSRCRFYFTFGSGVINLYGIFTSVKLHVLRTCVVNHVLLLQLLNANPMKAFYLIIFSLVIPIGIASAQIVPPYFENFENGPAGWYDSTYSGSSWEFGTPNYGLTTGALSGINAWDVDLDSAYKNNTACYLYSPTFDFSNITDAVMSFWLNYSTEVQWDAINLQYSTDTGITWKYFMTNGTLPAVNWISYSVFGYWGWWDSTNCWALSAIKLDSVYGFANVQFRFVFGSDPSIVHDGVSMDDFSIYTPQNLDAAIASINSPSGNSSQTFPLATATIANLGASTLTSVPVAFTINNGIANTSNYNGVLSSIDADVFSFGNFNAPTGIYTICFFTLLIGDSNPSNDTLCCEINNVINSSEEFNNESFIIYPNPSERKVLQIKNISIEGNYAIDIIDILGHTVYFREHLRDESINIFMEFSSGVYLLRLIHGSKTYSRKFVVE